MTKERVQRRLAAVVSADVVGYSAMMGRDETGTLSRLKALRAEFLHPKVAEYGGRIVKTTGDGTLIEFPSAVHAVQHAIDVQRGMAGRNAGLPEEHQIRLRVGINVGDIIVDGDDIYGDGVNVAARIEGLAKPGQTYVSSSVYEQVRRKLALDFEDMGEQAVKNIAEPVHVYRVDEATSDGAAGSATDADAMFRRPAIAVLPFENMSGDAEQEYFSDGLTEDIISALSRWRSFPVIARNSTFAYKGTSPDIRQVGKELGARYIIEGSVRKAGGRVRVTAQLINAGTGHHIWAERYDRDLADIFDLQDELSQRIAATIAPELEYGASPEPRTRAPQNLDAWDLVQRGYSQAFVLDLNHILSARSYFERAIQIDPDYSSAYTGMAWTYHREFVLKPENFTGEAKQRFIDTANRAAVLDDKDSQAHTIASMMHGWTQENDRALSEAKRAVDLNPNNPQAQMQLGRALTMFGRPTEGLRHMEQAMLLSPRDPRHGFWMFVCGLAYLIAGDFERSINWAQRAIERHAENPHAHLVLASALGHLGKRDAATGAFATYRRLTPGASGLPRLLWRAENGIDEEIIHAGLRKAGVQV